MGAIFEVYEKTRKRPDLFWNSYVCRPLAAPVVWLLAPTRVTPNQVTLFAFVVAMAAAAILAVVPGYWALVLGVVIFELSYVLDCADGMLARWRNEQSEVGHLLDFLMDEIKAFFILAAASLRLWRDKSDEQFLVLGLLGLACLATGIALTTFQRRPKGAEVAATPSKPVGSPSLLRRGIGWVERTAKLLIHYPSYILLVALANRLEFYFYPYICVNALYAARTLVSVAREHGRSRSKEPV